MHLTVRATNKENQQNLYQTTVFIGSTKLIFLNFRQDIAYIFHLDKTQIDQFYTLIATCNLLTP